MVLRSLLAAGLATGALGFMDCVGQIFSIEDCTLGKRESCWDWVGDKTCDNGLTVTPTGKQLFLNCAHFDYDGGDCEGNKGNECTKAISEKPKKGECPLPVDFDSNTMVVDCWGQVLTAEDCTIKDKGYDSCDDWFRDGQCDGGQSFSDNWSLPNFNCEVFDYDGGDCTNQNPDLTWKPSPSPTVAPTPAPTSSPTGLPSAVPSPAPTFVPTTPFPTSYPTQFWGQVPPPRFAKNLTGLKEMDEVSWGNTYQASGKTFPADSAPTSGTELIAKSPPTGWTEIVTTHDYEYFFGCCRGGAEYGQRMGLMSSSTCGNLCSQISDCRAYETTGWRKAVADESDEAFGECYLFSGDPDIAVVNGCFGEKYEDDHKCGAQKKDTMEHDLSTGQDDEAVGENKLAAGYLSTYVFVPANQASVNLNLVLDDVSEFYVFLNNRQVFGSKVMAKESEGDDGAGDEDGDRRRRLQEDDDAEPAGPNVDWIPEGKGGVTVTIDIEDHDNWNKVQIVAMSKGDWGKVSIAELSTVQACFNRLDELCDIWAMNPEMCDNEELRPMCRVTCRITELEGQEICVLPQAVEASAMFSFENDSAQDSTGTEHDARMRGSAIIDSDPRFGGVAKFAKNESGDVVTDVEISLPMTACVWVMPENGGGEDQTVFNSASAEECQEAEKSNSFGVFILDGKFVMAGNNNQIMETGVAAVMNKWQNICAIYGANSMEFYYNGVSMGKRDATFADNFAANDIKLGGSCGNEWHEKVQKAGDASNFVGMLDEAVFFNVALKPNEVNRVYSADRDKGLEVLAGMRVTANVDGDWIPCTITEVQEHNPLRYKCQADDSTNYVVLREQIRASAGGASLVDGFRLRMPVRVNRFGRGIWSRALIRIRQDRTTYTVEYEADGAVETNVPEKRIELIVSYLQDDNVLARQCFWYEGVIVDVNPDGKYLVNFPEAGGDFGFQTKDFDELKPRAQEVFEAGDVVLVEVAEGEYEKAWVLMGDMQECRFMVGIIKDNSILNDVPCSKMSKYDEGGR